MGVITQESFASVKRHLFSRPVNPTGHAVGNVDMALACQPNKVGGVSLKIPVMGCHDRIPPQGRSELSFTGNTARYH
jgi:hypothetical protein